MPPCNVGSVAAVGRKARAYPVIRTEIRFQVFRLTKNTENEHSICERIGYYRSRPPQPVFPIVEVDQENHESIWPTMHLRYMD